LDQDQIIEILDHAKAMDPVYCVGIVNAKIDTFEICDDEYVSLQSFRELGEDQ
jgi:hypothetical protein